jgi:hypothetical protein
MSGGIWCAECQTIHLYEQEWDRRPDKIYDDPLWSPDDDEGDGPIGKEGARKVG